MASVKAMSIHVLMGDLISLQACAANGIMHCSRGVDHNLEPVAKAA
jgi:hypothetical protein